MVVGPGTVASVEIEDGVAVTVAAGTHAELMVIEKARAKAQSIDVRFAMFARQLERFEPDFNPTVTQL